MNTNKVLIALGILAVVLGGGYFLWQQQTPVAPAVVVTDNTPQPSAMQPDVSQPLPTPLPQVPPTPAPVPTNSTEVVVTFTDNGYSPKELTIKKGTTVVFKNESSRPSWTASALHPTHTVYPTTGGCLGSTFDACKGIEPGSSWSFTFDVVGSWNYHDHLNATKFGKIIVE